jgi:hypothetical protein
MGLPNELLGIFVGVAETSKGLFDGERGCSLVIRRIVLKRNDIDGGRRGHGRRVDAELEIGRMGMEIVTLAERKIRTQNAKISDLVDVLTRGKRVIVNADFPATFLYPPPNCKDILQTDKIAKNKVNKWRWRRLNAST